MRQRAPQSNGVASRRAQYLPFRGVLIMGGEGDLRCLILATGTSREYPRAPRKAQRYTLLELYKCRELCI
jgi:hypothetical protein